MSTSQQGQGFAHPTSGYAQPAAPETPVAAPAPVGTQQTPQTAPTASTQPQTRQAAEEARKDRTLAEFMLMLDDYEPLVREYLFCRPAEQD